MTDLYERTVERAREIRTDAYSMSIGEVISMYRDGDLEIHPEFQRIFRWGLDQVVGEDGGSGFNARRPSSTRFQAGEALVFDHQARVRPER